MIHWGWLIVAVWAGAFLGIVILALLNIARGNW